jgi:predicted transcriptional regulator
MGNKGHETVTDKEILRAIRDHRAPAVGSSDIGSAVGVSRQAVDRRLRNFEDEEPSLVKSDKVGQVRIWWLTTEGRELIQDG